MQIFVSKYFKAEIPFHFFTESVSAKTLLPASGADISVAAAPSWHGADIKATSIMCCEAYSGIYLTLISMSLEKTPAPVIITWASTTGSGDKQAF